MYESYRAEFEIVETGQRFGGTVVPIELKSGSRRKIVSIHADADVVIPLDKPLCGIASIRETLPEGTTRTYKVYNGDNDRHLVQI